MRASLHMPIPNLTAGGSDAKANEIGRLLGLSVRGVDGEHTPIGHTGIVDISPSARFCISEAEIMAALYKGVRLLKKEEDERARDGPEGSPEALEVGVHTVVASSVGMGLAMVSITAAGVMVGKWTFATALFGCFESKFAAK
eukprot:gene24618-biopygen25451